MKKIIYSLVIMIAAGSLFTSCIDPVEPNGIYDLREAKADYLAALSNLRAADAEVREADAALVNAQAAVQQAIAAEHQAQADWQKLVNELKIAQNDKEKAELQAAIDSIEAKAAQDAVTAQKTLAEEQQKLAEALKKIAAEAMVLTKDEQAVITRAASDFNAAVEKYNDAFEDWKDNAQNYYASSMNAKDYEAELAQAQERLAKWQGVLADFQNTDNEPAQWKAALDKYQAEVDSLNYALIMLDEGRAKEYLDARDAFAALVEYAQGLVEEYGEPEDLTLSKLVDLPTNKFITDAIEKLIEIVASGNAKFVNEGGKIGFDEISLEKAKEILYGIADVAGDIDTLGLVDIVEILNRDSVITNSNYVALADSAAAKAKIADSLYDAHKAILEKGVAEFGTVKNAIAKYKTDTAGFAEANKNWSNNAYRYNDGTFKGKTDTTAIIAAVNKAKADYDSVALVLYHQMCELLNLGFVGKTTNDTAAFINNLHALGQAQKALGYKEADSVAVYKYNSLNTTTHFDTSFVRIDAIVKEDLVIKVASGNYVYSKVGGNGKGMNNIEYYMPYEEFSYEQESSGSAGLFKGRAAQASADAFIRIFNAVLADASDFNNYGNYMFAAGTQASADANFLAALNRKLVISAASANATDTVTWAQKNLKDNAKVKDLATHKADHDTAQARFTRLETKKNDVTAIKGAYNEFYKVYDAFWGYPTGTNMLGASDNAYKSIKDSLTINWGEKTFEGILTMVPKLTGAGASANAFAFQLGDYSIAKLKVAENAKLAAVLDALRNGDVDVHATKYENFLEHPEYSHIIRGQVSGEATSGNATEFVETIAWNWLKEYYSTYADNQAAVKAFAANVDALVAAYDAQVSANAVAQAEFAEKTVAIVGEEASADAVWATIRTIASGTATYSQFSDMTAEQLAAKIGTGSFAAKATELLGAFVTADVTRKKAEEAMEARIKDLKGLMNQLSKVYFEALSAKDNNFYQAASGNAQSFGASGNAASGNAAAFQKAWEDAVKYINGKITEAQTKVTNAEDALALLEAGYSAEDVTAKYYAAMLAQYEQALADAKAELDFYRAQYEAVMKKFFGQNN